MTIRAFDWGKHHKAPKDLQAKKAKAKRAATEKQPPAAAAKKRSST